MERVTKVSLLLNATNYVRGQMEAERATNKTKDACALAAEKLNAQKQAMESTGRASLLMGTLAAAGIAVAVKKYADFDQAMSNVAATGQDAKNNLVDLRQAALDAGAATVFSATEAANAIEVLLKANVSARDVLSGGLRGSLDLAAAGGLGVAEAAGIASTAMQQFKLRGEDMAHVADLLAAGAGKAMGDVTDLGQALNQAGLVAKGTGLSIEETTAGLAAFANAGLLGSDAGTAFKAMLQRLTPQSREAKDLMAELGISAYDAQGNFIGLASFAGNLADSLRDLTPEQRNSALATIFGSDAVRAANVLYEEGERGIRKWTKAVDDQGYASEQAADRLDNLKGDWEAFLGALDTGLIETGSAANDGLRELVQMLTGLVDIYNELPQDAQNTVLAIGGVTAAIALTTGALLTGIPKWTEFKRAVETSGTSLSKTALTGGVAALALGGLFAIVGELATRQAEARQTAASYADALAYTGESAEIAVRKLVTANLQAGDSFLWMEGESAYDAAEKLGIGLDLVTEAALGNKKAQRELKEELAGGGLGSKEFKDRLDELGLSLTDYSRLSTVVTQGVEAEATAQERAKELISQKNEVEEEGIGITESAATAYNNAATEVESLNSELATLIDNINKANGVGQDAITANLNYKDALSEVDEVIRQAREGVDANQDGVADFALSLDEATQAGRDNKKMLVDLAQQSQDAAQKQFDLDGNTAAYKKTLEDGRQTLIDRATQLGLNADEAQALADQIYRIPSDTEWQVIAETKTAREVLDGFIRDYSGRQVPLYVTTMKNRDGSPVNIGQFAGGGGIYGPGTKGVDSVHILAAPGEHMFTAREVDLMGGQQAVYAFRAALRAGAVPRYAGGGEIQPRYAAPVMRIEGAVSRARDVNVTIPVYPQPGMSEYQIGQAAAQSAAFWMGTGE